MEFPCFARPLLAADEPEPSATHVDAGAPSASAEALPLLAPAGFGTLNFASGHSSSPACNLKFSESSGSCDDELDFAVPLVPRSGASDTSMDSTDASKRSAAASAAAW